MTLERGLEEDRTTLERSPSVRCQELCVHDPSVPDVQCLFCIQAGPVVEAKCERADPRREAFERVLKQLSRYQFVGKEGSAAENLGRKDYLRPWWTTVFRGISCKW